MGTISAMCSVRDKLGLSTSIILYVIMMTIRSVSQSEYPRWPMSSTTDSLCGDFVVDDMMGGGGERRREEGGGGGGR